MHFNGIKLSGALEQFSITSQFFGSKCKTIIFLKKNKGFDCSCFRIEVQVISTSLTELKRHQTPEFSLMNDFLCLF